MNHTAKAEIRQTVQRLIESGSAYDVDALDRIYHKGLKIIKIDDRDDVTVINREENMAFLRSKLDSGAEPLSREAKLLYAETDERNGHVVVMRRMRLTDKFEKSVFSIRLVWEDGRWQVIQETAFVQAVAEEFSNMMHPAISTEDASYRKRVSVFDTNMAYVDVGEGDPIVFLHGNPTPSYLWRNIIPYLLPFGRCLAPDFVGMGNSGAAPDGSYRFVDHQRYLDAWFEAMGLKENIILIVHDWGSALGFSWAQRHAERIKAIVYMEAIVRPFLSWNEWPEATREFFKAQRTPAGEELILQKNLFIEYLLPLRGISKEAMEVYRRHYRNPGPLRQPMLTWTRELPIEGQPEDVTQIVDSYSRWLAASAIPKLFIDGDPAGFLIGAQREFCRAWPNQQEITVKGAHFLQEDAPHEVGEATARFVAKVLAGQIS